MKKQVLFAVTVGLTTKNGRELSQDEIQAIINMSGKMLEFISITELTGYYKGVKERSLKIEHIGPPETGRVIHVLARTLQHNAEQESVMITETEIKAEFIS